MGVFCRPSGPIGWVYALGTERMTALPFIIASSLSEFASPVHRFSPPLSFARLIHPCSPLLDIIIDKCGTLSPPDFPPINSETLNLPPLARSQRSHLSKDPLPDSTPFIIDTLSSLSTLSSASYRRCSLSLHPPSLSPSTTIA